MSYRCNRTFSRAPALMLPLCNSCPSYRAGPLAKAPQGVTGAGVAPEGGGLARVRGRHGAAAIFCATHLFGLDLPYCLLEGHLLFPDA